MLRKKNLVPFLLIAVAVATGVDITAPAQAQERSWIQHDAEHYMLLAQHGDRWAQEDKAIEAKLAEVRQANGGKPPNILFVLIDDVGFGEMGAPCLTMCVGTQPPISTRLHAKA